MAKHQPQQFDDEGTAQNIRERLIAQHPDIDPDILQEIKAVERMAYSKTIQVSTNTSFPRGWSFERWMAVGMLASTVVTWVFVVGSRYEKIQSEIVGLKNSVLTVQTDLGVIHTDLTNLGYRVDMSAQRVEALTDSSQRRTPIFSGESHTPVTRTSPRAPEAQN